MQLGQRVPWMQTGNKALIAEERKQTHCCSSWSSKYRSPMKLHQHDKMILFLSWSVSAHPTLNCHFLSLSLSSPLCSQGSSGREDRDDLVRLSSHTPSNKAQILAMPQFNLRDNLIKCELLKNEDLYTYLENFRYVSLILIVAMLLCKCL